LKIALFSDIHGNLPALEIAIKEAGDVDGYIVLGDVVNYGPWTNECVNMLETLPHCTKIRGNHEDFFINGKCDSDDYLANEFFNHCYKDFEEVSTILAYEKEIQFEDFICTHTLQDKYIFEDTDLTLVKNYIIGHSHRQYKIDYNGYVLLNPGSVGQNRKFINEINFMIYETTTHNVDFCSVLYNVNSVIDRMVVMEYPKICLDYYRSKPRK
jgi:putative phosphoesterase|tara:strand:+ start:182 stop:817 length:636 start_codon:yes stop_codon:yes gene_type:complete